MSIIAANRARKLPLVGALWTLTLFALIPFGNLPLVLLGAVANLAANSLALVLLCSRSRVDRIHGLVRLALQVVILILGAIAFARSGITLIGLYHYVTRGTP